MREVSVEIKVQTHSNCMKNRNVRNLTANATAISRKMIMFKACILSDLYQQSQFIKI